MNFGEVFKNNRKRLGYTQEEVANRLMVTPQAVSKWENSSALPDITLLIPMSRLFGISTDELLGNELKGTKEIQDELDETKNMDVDIREEYSIYINMLKECPNSRDLIIRILGCTAEVLAKYGSEMDDEEKLKFISNAERLSQDIRCLGEREHTNEYTYSHAFLADVYISACEYEKAEREIAYLPYSRYNKARMLGRLRTREKKFKEAVEQYRESISDAIYWLFWDIERLAHCLWRANGDNNDSLKIFKLEYNLIHLLYSDCKYPIPVTAYLLHSNIQLAAHNARKGNDDIVFAHFNEIIEVINEYNKCFGNSFSTGCILYPKAIQPFNIAKKKISYKDWLKNCISWSSFDLIKNDVRYTKIKEFIDSID